MTTEQTWTRERHDRLRAHVDGTRLCGGAFEVSEEDAAAMLAEIERLRAEQASRPAPLPPELAPDALVCLYCEAPSGEMHSPMCAIRAGAPRLYKVKGAASPAPLTEAEAEFVGAARSCASLEWGKSTYYTGPIVLDLESGGAKALFRLRAAYLALSTSRGDIPVDVRPVGASACDCGHPSSDHYGGDAGCMSCSCTGLVAGPADAQPSEPRDDVPELWAAFRPFLARIARGEWTGTVLGVIQSMWRGGLARGQIIETEDERARRVEAVARQAVWDKALREPPTAPVEPGSVTHLLPGDMTSALLAAPLDSTPETPEERAAFEAVEADIRAGKRGAGPAEIEGRLREMRSAGEGGHGVAEPCDECGGRRVITCRANRDGDCSWKGCPQTRDGEPKKSGRHCPRDAWAGRDEDEDVRLPPCPKCSPEPWRPTVGARVVTAADLDPVRTARFGPRLPRSSGTVKSPADDIGEALYVTHDSGEIHAYLADELAPAPEVAAPPCPEPCGHSAGEHAAFDAGRAAGLAGTSALDYPRSPPLSPGEIEAWLSGHSSGSCDRRGAVQK